MVTTWTASARDNACEWALFTGEIVILLGLVWLVSSCRSARWGDDALQHARNRGSAADGDQG